MGAVLSVFLDRPTPPIILEPFKLMDLPHEVRQNILLTALTETYKKDINVMSIRYVEEEDSSTWNSYSNGERPLQGTYNLARKLNSAFAGNGLLNEELEYVLTRVVADVDVRIGRFHGEIDVAITQLAILIRSMIMLSLEDVDQKRAMGQNWCDDWEWLSLEWIVYHRHKMNAWKVGKSTENPIEGGRESVDRSVRERRVEDCPFDRCRVRSVCLRCLVKEDERWTEDLQHF